MEKEEIIEYLKNEKNIEWLVALNKWLNSHIEFLNRLEELSNIKEKTNASQ